MGVVSRLFKRFDVARKMSAFPPKADIFRTVKKSLLLTQSGHSVGKIFFMIPGITPLILSPDRISPHLVGSPVAERN